MLQVSFFGALVVVAATLSASAAPTPPGHGNPEPLLDALGNPYILNPTKHDDVSEAQNLDPTEPLLGNPYDDVSEAQDHDPYYYEYLRDPLGNPYVFRFPKHDPEDINPNSARVPAPSLTNLYGDSKTNTRADFEAAYNDLWESKSAYYLHGKVSKAKKDAFVAIHTSRALYRGNTETSDEFTYDDLLKVLIEAREEPWNKWIAASATGADSVAAVSAWKDLTEGDTVLNFFRNTLKPK